MTDPDTRRLAEYAERAKWLTQRICPDSGERLTWLGDGPTGTLSCAMCDCFGYVPDPDEDSGLLDLTRQYWEAQARHD